MKNIIIFGAPGSGKGTQSDKLIAEYKLAHISTGDVLRGEMAAKTELGTTAAAYINDGKLVPDGIIIGMLRSTLDSLSGVPGVIFDGFPRTIAQAEALDKMLAERGEKVNVVVGLEVDDAELVKRIIARGRISGRSDDNEATAKKRLETYYSQTLPLKEFYIAQGKYAGIDGVGDIDDIFANIKKAIE
ncbi:MAG: adenylate kinase [Prevotella sp.]|nr:adenylate kinase [Prevotella sp.]MCD8289436.1 adenylate kinase [Prevotella sp.]